MDQFQHLPLICVSHVRNAARFGLPPRFLENLRRNNLPTIVSTFHVSELWLLTLFPPAVLFHLMCCHHWAKFTKNSYFLFLDSRTWYCLYFSVMLCCNCSQFVVQFIVAFLLNFRCSKTVIKAIERGFSIMIAHQVQSKLSPKISS